MGVIKVGVGSAFIFGRVTMRLIKWGVGVEVFEGLS